MANKAPPKIGLNIFLLKEKADKSKWEQAEFLAKTVNSLGRSKAINTKAHSLKLEDQIVGDLYLKTPTANRPDWVGFVESGVEDASALKSLTNKSVSALLVTEAGNRQFAIAFGHGRHMLDQSCIEYRFGIKTVLNTVEPTKIVSIDRQSFEATPKLSRTQTLKKSSIAEYGVDPSKDLLRAIAGEVKAKHKMLGDIVAGMDSFKTVVPVQLKDLKEFLKSTLERSLSKDYLLAEGGRDGAFAWIDKLQHITDPVKVAELDEQLWQAFQAEDFSSMWLAIPEIIDWEGTAGFAYTAAQSKEIANLPSVLDIKEFRDSFGADAKLETLKRRALYHVQTSDGRAASYPAYRCIYAEITLGKEQLCVLNAGAWYQVDKSFQAQVDDHFKDLVDNRMAFAAPFIEYMHKDEGAYNAAVSKLSAKTYALLDRKQIYFGGNHSSIEVCDLLMHPSNGHKGQLVHVKRGRSSATLSHLFAQGLVSSTLLTMEKDFVRDVNVQLKKHGVAELPYVPVTTDYEVIFGIVDGAAGAPLSIPFFSKVNLQNCARTIRAFGYGVRLLHIPESAKHLAAKVRKKTAKKVVP